MFWFLVNCKIKKKTIFRYFIYNIPLYTCKNWTYFQIYSQKRYVPLANFGAKKINFRIFQICILTQIYVCVNFLFVSTHFVNDTIKLTGAWNYLTTDCFQPIIDLIIMYKHRSSIKMYGGIWKSGMHILLCVPRNCHFQWLVIVLIFCGIFGKTTDFQYIWIHINLYESCLVGFWLKIQ